MNISMQNSESSSTTINKDFKAEIVNIVATFSLDATLNLKEIHQRFANESLFGEAIFNYNVVVLRAKKPKMSFLIYRTGSIVCTGAKSLEDAKQSGEYLVNLFRNVGINAQLSRELEINNIVVKADVGSKLNLDAIVTNSVLENVEYEPEQFPGLIYRINERGANCTITLFSSGNMIIAGLKDTNKIYKVIERLISDLKIV